MTEASIANSSIVNKTAAAVETKHTHGPHTHGAHAPNRSRLRAVLILTAVYLVAEAVGGWFTGSLALLADAGHMLTDVAALALALFALWFSSRPATPQKTFGYYRLEILAALINGIALILISLLIIYEAYLRWSAPPEIRSGPMIVVAAGGLIINLVCAGLLHGSHRDDLNMRGAWLHLLGDALGSVGAIVAGALMLGFGWYAADPLISILISLLIVWSAWRLIHDSVNILLEGTPAHISLAAVEAAIRQTDGVDDVHDLHVWTITSGHEALSAHVIHGAGVAQPELLYDLRHKLAEQFGVEHLTIQMETAAFEDEKVHFCQTGTTCFRSERV
jgi:cobalt-zinc-cadmium efflux system protein